MRKLQCYSICCELLSFCIFEILNTVPLLIQLITVLLWIAFILYLWNIEHSCSNCTCIHITVVNCFHFVSLKYWTQWTSCLFRVCFGCELLSFCIFEILNTVYGDLSFQYIKLWIAFILYLWNIEHSCFINRSYNLVVVNCFHFVSLKYWTQFFLNSFGTWDSCELLSFCIFEILNTVPRNRTY